MSHDYVLFGEPTDGGAPLDADLSLIAAYLARELSPVQMLAVKRRLATDPAFSATVGGILDAWAAPLELDAAGPVRGLSSADVARGWDKHVASVRAEESEQRRSTQRSVRRAAVIVLAIVLPAIGIAQMVRVMQRGDSTPSFVAPPAAASHALGRDVRGAVPLQQVAGQSSGQLPAVRALGPIIAQTTEPFDSVSRLVVFSDGRVLLSDIRNKRIKAFDARLANARLVLDANTAKPHWYSPSSHLLPFRGDSALFVDQDGAVVVMDARGVLGRDVAVPDIASPKPHLGVLANTFGDIHVSPAFGMIVRARAFPRGQPRLGPNDTLRNEDTVAVIASRLDTRRVDTLAFIGTGSVTHATAPQNKAEMRAPFPFYDEVVVSADGSVAIFHAREFRVEWIGADGARTIGPSLPYSWRPIAQEDRQRLVDSLNAQQLTDSETRRDMARTLSPIDVDLATIFQSIGVKRFRIPGDSTPPAVSTVPQQFRPVALGPRPPVPPPIPWVVDELPALAPPTGRNAVLADGDNNVWIRPVAEPGAPPGEVWWVVNRSGQLTDRIRIPEGRRLVGFGTGGMAYLLRRGAGGSVLEKASIAVRPDAPPASTP
jgi:hypothetical protein